MELNRLLIKPVRILDATQSNRWVQVQQQRHVRNKAARRHFVHFPQPLQIQPSSISLINHRRIRVPITKDHRSSVQRRANAGNYVLRPVGKKKEQLGNGFDGLTAEQNLTNLRPEVAVPWFSSHHYLVPAQSQPVRHHADDRSLARALWAFEGD